MNIEIRSKGRQLSTAQRERATRRLGFALDHVAASIRTVEMRMGSEPAPGGEAKRCDITIRLIRGGHVHVSEAASNVAQSLDRAANSAARRVVKHLGRRRRRTSETLRVVV